jgi:hypothetical protein
MKKQSGCCAGRRLEANRPSASSPRLGFATEVREGDARKTLGGTSLRELTPDLAILAASIKRELRASL